MREILLKKAKNRLNPREEELFLNFCNEQVEVIKDRFSLADMKEIIIQDNIIITPMLHTSELSSILGQLLVKTDKIQIIINEDILKKISREQNLDYEILKELIVLHEFLHYYSYKNKIRLEYKPKGLLKMKIRESEEIIVNDLVDYYLQNEISIYTIYRYI